MRQGRSPDDSFAALAQMIAGPNSHKATTNTTTIASVIPANDLHYSIGSESLRMAASQGDARAQFVIAGRYVSGDSVARNFSQAFRWYEKAAAQGLAPAQFRLAGLYQHGRGVAKNDLSAQLWYGRAAASGNVKAMHNLAVVLAERAREPADYKLAAEWFRTAAEHGLQDSQFNLGILYHRGFGVGEDTGQAYYWLRLAEIQGDEAAAAKVRMLREGLPPRDRTEIEKRLADFRPKENDRIANIVPVGDPTWQPRPAQMAADKSGNEVAHVQSMLLRLGFDIGIADGRMSMKTENAIRLFQLQNGMAVNGQVGWELLTRLEQRQS